MQNFEKLMILFRIVDSFYIIVYLNITRNFKIKNFLFGNCRLSYFEILNGIVSHTRIII